MRVLATKLARRFKSAKVIKENVSQRDEEIVIGARVSALLDEHDLLTGIKSELHDLDGILRGTAERPLVEESDLDLPLECLTIAEWLLHVVARASMLQKVCGQELVLSEG